jgi:hypothetical protein
MHFFAHNLDGKRAACFSRTIGALVKRCNCAGTHRPAGVPLRTAQGAPSGGKFDSVNWFTERLPHLV